MNAALGVLMYLGPESAPAERPHLIQVNLKWCKCTWHYTRYYKGSKAYVIVSKKFFGQARLLFMKKLYLRGKKEMI